eukprot:Nk52_evm39s250 gene=Nk52_evmTU39s250
MPQRALKASQNLCGSIDYYYYTSNNNTINTSDSDRSGAGVQDQQQECDHGNSSRNSDSTNSKGVVEIVMRDPELKVSAAVGYMGRGSVGQETEGEEEEEGGKEEGLEVDKKGKVKGFAEENEAVAITGGVDVDGGSSRTMLGKPVENTKVAGSDDFSEKSSQDIDGHVPDIAGLSPASGRVEPVIGEGCVTDQENRNAGKNQLGDINTNITLDRNGATIDCEKNEGKTINVDDGNSVPDMNPGIELNPETEKDKAPYEKANQGRKSMICADDVNQLLNHFVQFDYTEKQYEDYRSQVQKICAKLYERDYDIAVIDNSNGRLCNSYPPEIIVPLREKTARDGNQPEDLATSGNASGRKGSGSRCYLKTLFSTDSDIDFDEDGLKGKIDDLSMNGNSSEEVEKRSKNSVSSSASSVSFTTATNTIAATLGSLFETTRFARVRCRFPVPVLMCRNKVICRSGTLSQEAEVKLNIAQDKIKKMIYGTGNSSCGPVVEPCMSKEQRCLNNSTATDYESDSLSNPIPKVARIARRSISDCPATKYKMQFENSDHAEKEADSAKESLKHCASCKGESEEFSDLDGVRRKLDSDGNPQIDSVNDTKPSDGAESVGCKRASSHPNDKSSIGEGSVEAGVTYEAASTGNTMDKNRNSDIQLLEVLNVKYICDLMVEKKKVKFGLTVSSSEKVDSHQRYRNFSILTMPYPGVEIFRDVSKKDEPCTSEGKVFFDWSQTFADAEFSLPDEPWTTCGGIDWREYKQWDLTQMTKNYLKLLLNFIRSDCDKAQAKSEGSSGSENSDADPIGMLLHCISGWDRTPMFISMLRLSLWADGEIHTSLNAWEMLYFTLGHDWLLYGHLLKDRTKRGEDILYFCFHFLKSIMGDEFSIFSTNNMEFVGSTQNLMEKSEAFLGETCNSKHLRKHSNSFGREPCVGPMSVDVVGDVSEEPMFDMELQLDLTCEEGLGMRNKYMGHNSTTSLDDIANSSKVFNDNNPSHNRMQKEDSWVDTPLSPREGGASNVLDIESTNRNSRKDGALNRSGCAMEGISETIPIDNTRNSYTHEGRGGSYHTSVMGSSLSPGHCSYSQAQAGSWQMVSSDHPLSYTSASSEESFRLAGGASNASSRRASTSSHHINPQRRSGSTSNLATRSRVNSISSAHGGRPSNSPVYSVLPGVSSHQSNGPSQPASSDGYHGDNRPSMGTHVSHLDQNRSCAAEVNASNRHNFSHIMGVRQTSRQYSQEDEDMLMSMGLRQQRLKAVRDQFKFAYVDCMTKNAESKDAMYGLWNWMSKFTS